MMFLEYFALGATLPVLSHYLKNGLGFTPFQVGLVLAMAPVAALASPFITVRLADRIVSAERLLGACHLAAGLAMGGLYFVQDFRIFLALYFAWGLAFTPTLGLANAVAFHHCLDARREFGVVRSGGTVGWIAVAWLFGFFWLSGGGSLGAVSDRLQHALLLSCATSVALAAFTLTIPRSVAVAHRPPASPTQALRLLAQPGLALLCLVIFANAVLNQYYHYGMSPFLSQIGFADRWIMPAMSLGQIPEIAGLALLGVVLARFGVRVTLLFGLGMQAVRFFTFATCLPALSLLAIPCHGLSSALFGSTAVLYVDEHCVPEVRASAQLLVAFIIQGVGNLSGSLLAGQSGEWFSEASGRIAFTPFWLIPATIGTVALLALAFLFRETPPGGRADAANGAAA